MGDSSDSSKEDFCSKAALASEKLSDYLGEYLIDRNFFSNLKGCIRVAGFLAYGDKYFFSSSNPSKLFTEG